MAPLIPLIGQATLALGISASTATAIAQTALTVGKVAGIAGKIGGVVLPIVGAIQEGQATAGQAEIEQLIAEGQATQEEIRGEEEARLRRKAGDKLEARQRAQFAKGGVRVGEGTPLLVMAETLLDTQQDISAIRETTGAKASTFRARGRTFRAIGKQAKRSSRLKAGASLLSGISSLTT